MPTLMTKYRTIAFLLISALANAGCSSLLYYPTRDVYVDTAKLQNTPEDIEFKSEDGTRLHAWRFRSPSKEPSTCVILQFHGNAQNLTSHFLFLYSALDHGYDFMIFDYRGYGRSEGEPDPAGTVADGRSALREIKRLYPDRKVVVVGQSLGGAVGLRSVLDLKSEVPVAFFVADSTFSSYRSAARKVLSKSWITWLFQPLGWLLMSDRHAPKDDLARLSPTPLLVIHGDKDPVIDLSLGREIYERASEPKEFWLDPGGGHLSFLSFGRKENAKRLYSRLDEVCRPGAHR